MFNLIHQISGIGLNDLSQPVFWMSILSIILIDLVLSGDNAIIIALACKNLHPNQQTKGILWGSGAAVFLRIIFASTAIYLLKIPLLEATGGLVLLWVAIKLVSQEKESCVEVNAPQRLWTAVKTIVIADAVMSLDNILALAGASHGKPGLLWFGLVISIPLVVYGSKILLLIMDKIPWLNILGAAVIGWIAGQMLIHDPGVQEYLTRFSNLPLLLDGKLIGVLCAIGVVFGGFRLKKRLNKTFIS